MSHRLAGALATGSFVVSSALCVVGRLPRPRVGHATPPTEFGVKGYAPGEGTTVLGRVPDER